MNILEVASDRAYPVVSKGGPRFNDGEEDAIRLGMVVEERKFKLVIQASMCSIYQRQWVPRGGLQPYTLADAMFINVILEDRCV